MSSTAAKPAHGAHEKASAFEWGFLVAEIIMIVLYSTCTTYGAGVHPAAGSTKSSISKIESSTDPTLLAFLTKMEKEDRVQAYYPVFQDVHVMIYVGFGFLMVFLKKHCWTSVGFNYIIAAWSMQLAILLTGFWHMALVEEEFHKITLDIPSLIIGDFGAGAVLISFGAILGKCTLPQLFVLATLEIIFYALNEGICAGLLQAVDMGGSMYVHTFGAYFGLAASYHFKQKLCNKSPAADDNEGGYLSQTIAMVGTIFLFMFWPSFNGALASENQQQRVIINTILSITASTLASAAVCRIAHGKLEMEVILNATLAGGVSVGSASDLVVTGGIAMAIGCLAGIVSALGFLYLGGWLREKIGLMDTCGVHNLHGLPGVLGAVIGSISAASSEMAFEDDTASLQETFKAMKTGRTAGEQGWIQLGALGITLVISILSGSLCGYLASHVGIQKDFNLFKDDDHWETEHGIDYNLEINQVIQTTAIQEQNALINDKSTQQLNQVDDSNVHEDSETRKKRRKSDKKEKKKEEKAAAAAEGDADKDVDSRAN